MARSEKEGGGGEEEGGGRVGGQGVCTFLVKCFFTGTMARRVRCSEIVL